MICLAYALYAKNPHWTELQEYFAFEVPFDFIITATIVQFFQWLQFACFLFKKNKQLEESDLEESGEPLASESRGYRLIMLLVLLLQQVAILLKLAAVISNMED